jgi:uncharacterized protein (TIGR00725 family)
MKTITVFGNGRTPETEPQYQKAYQIGKLAGAKGLAICTGGYGGIMEAASKGAKEAGSKTIGITVKDSGGWANPFVTEERAMPAWRERLDALMETGDAYVIFDGATGTLVELFMLWEMTNKKLIQKPIIVMGDDLKSFIAGLRGKPFYVFNDYLKTADTPEEALQHLRSL